MVKLKSGREIEVKALTFKQRAPIKDELERNIIEFSERIKDVNKALNLALSLELSGRIVLMATELKDDDLDQMEDNEIRMLAGDIISKSYISDTDKKK